MYYLLYKTPNKTHVLLPPQAIPPPPAPIPPETQLLSQGLNQALLVPGDRVCE